MGRILPSDERNGAQTATNLHDPLHMARPFQSENMRTAVDPPHPLSNLLDVLVSRLCPHCIIPPLSSRRPRSRAMVPRLSRTKQDNSAPRPRQRRQHIVAQVSRAFSGTDVLPAF
jgi:hypothetical protein